MTTMDRGIITIAKGFSNTRGRARRRIGAEAGPEPEWPGFLPPPGEDYHEALNRHILQQAVRDGRRTRWHLEPGPPRVRVGSSNLRALGPPSNIGSPILRMRDLFRGMVFEIVPRPAAEAGIIFERDPDRHIHPSFVHFLATVHNIFPYTWDEKIYPRWIINKVLPTPIKDLIVDCILHNLKCHFCHQYDHMSMFACQLGHIGCRHCSLNPRLSEENTYYGFCSVCNCNRRLRRVDDLGLVSNFMFPCQYERVGCARKIYGRDYEKHVLTCQNAFHCFVCDLSIPAEEIENHLAIQDIDIHPRHTLMNIIGTDKKQKLTMNVPNPKQFAMASFNSSEYGKFFVYFIGLNGTINAWFLVHYGDYQNEFEVDFVLTAAYITDPENVKFVSRNTMKVFPWRTRTHDSIKEMFDYDHGLTKVAAFKRGIFEEKTGSHGFRITISFELRKLEIENRIWNQPNLVPKEDKSDEKE